MLCKYSYIVATVGYRLTELTLRILGKLAAANDVIYHLHGVI